MAAATRGGRRRPCRCRAGSPSAPARRWPSACPRWKQRLPARRSIGASPTGSRPRSSRRSRPIDDVRGSAGYRSDAVVTLLRRLLRGLRAVKVAFTLNGQAAGWNGPPITRLAAALRDDLGLTGTKVGCDAGDCGACTVLLDGRQVCACLVAMGQVEGRAGRDGRGPRRRQRQLTALQKSLPRPWRRPVRHLHAGHADGGRGSAAPHRAGRAAPRSRTRWAACSAAAPATARSSRPCMAARRRPAPAAAPPAGAAVGARLPRVDGVAKVTGRDRFGADARSGRCAVDPRRALAARARALRAGRSGAAARAPGRRADGRRRAVQRLRHLSRHQGPAGAGRRPSCAIAARRSLALVGERADGARHPRRRGADRLDARAAARSASMPRPRPTRRWCRPTSLAICCSTAACGTATRATAFAGCAAVAEGIFETAFVEHAYIEPEAGWAAARRRSHRDPRHAPRRPTWIATRWRA